MDEKKHTAKLFVFPVKQPQQAVKQTISGQGNVVVVGNNNRVTQHTNTTTKLKVEPPPGSIGAHGALRLRINDLIREIQEHRRARFGAEFKHGSVQGIAAMALGLKNTEWAQVWLWDVSRAPDVIEALERARNNTMQGRINKAARRPGYKHSRGHLFRIEKEHLEKLEWSDEQARGERRLVMGVESRSHMSDNDLANWVAHLDGLVRRLHGEA